MRNIAILETERLILRQWRDSDYDEWARLCGDQDVMRYFPKTLTREESDAAATRFRGLIAERGWGIFAAEVKGGAEFIGFIGLHMTNPALPFPTQVEVGWRLLKEHWGNGYATEGARESLRFAFEELALDEVLSFTAIVNERSWKVMERIGMTKAGLVFEHPLLPAGSELARHILYKITREEFLNQLPWFSVNWTTGVRY
ncbi:MAG: GNAT family N-acetyltransferase [Planctomycetes bacterium]|nr:GNAT family N-acetyltransferase [Planctomycetota bacterium]